MTSTDQIKNMPAKVRFAEASTLIIIHRNTPQERKKMWFIKRELKQFRDNTNESAQSMDKTPDVIAYILQSMSADKAEDKKYRGDVEKLCGVEHLICPEICRALLTSKCLTIQKVLEEQARQREMGEDGCNRLAEVSIKASLFSRLWRHRIAVMNCSD